jgi:Leucine-rich repeat (LRR) protein
MKQILLMIAAVVLVGCGTNNKTQDGRRGPMDLGELEGELIKARKQRERIKSLTHPFPPLLPQQPETTSEKLITDPIVEKAIREELEKPIGELTKAELAKVTSLSLFRTRITDAGLKEIAKLQQLTNLTLSDTQITDAGLKEVAKVQKLTVLGLHETNITDAGLKDIAKLKKLTHIILSDTQITDAGLKEVAKLQNLTHLHLDNTQITDAGLKDIAKLKKLKFLYSFPSKFTDAGVDELQKALPKCRIRW